MLSVSFTLKGLELDKQRVQLKYSDSMWRDRETEEKVSKIRFDRFVSKVHKFGFACTQKCVNESKKLCKCVFGFAPI